MQQYNGSPFLFAPHNVPPPPPALPPFSQYNPDNLKFDRATLNTIPPPRPAARAAPEIEMEDAYTYKASTPRESELSEGEGGKGTEVEVEPAIGHAAAQHAAAESAGPTQARVEDAPEEKRPIAKGAVTRARRRKAREWKKRYDTDTEGEEVSFVNRSPVPNSRAELT